MKESARTGLGPVCFRWDNEAQRSHKACQPIQLIDPTHPIHHKREARWQQETQRQKMNLTADGRRYLRTLYQPTV
jgi:hypothetical protein